MERKPSTRFHQNALTRWLIPIIIVLLVIGLIITMVIVFGVPPAQ